MTDGFRNRIEPGDTLVSDINGLKVVFVGEGKAWSSGSNTEVPGAILRAVDWTPSVVCGQVLTDFSVTTRLLQVASVWRKKV